MLDIIGDFILDCLKSLALGALFLFASLLVLPDSWVVYIVKKVKSGVVRKIEDPLVKLVNTITSLYVYNNIAIDLQEEDDTFNKRAKYLLDENEKIDKNVYVIDLCKDIVSTLEFTVSRSPQYDGLCDDIFDYLFHYSRLITSLDQKKDLFDDFYDKIYELNNALNNGNDDGLHHQHVKEIFDCLKKDKDALEEIKEKNKEELVRLLKGKMNG